MVNGFYRTVGNVPAPVQALSVSDSDSSRSLPGIWDTMATLTSGGSSSSAPTTSTSSNNSTESRKTSGNTRASIPKTSLHKRQKKEDSCGEPLLEMMATVSNYCQSRQNTRELPFDDEVFGQMIACSISQYSPELKLAAKSELMGVLSKYNLKKV